LRKKGSMLVLRSIGPLWGDGGLSLENTGGTQGKMKNEWGEAAQEEPTEGEKRLLKIRTDLVQDGSCLGGMKRVVGKKKRDKNIHRGGKKKKSRKKRLSV